MIKLQEREHQTGANDFDVLLCPRCGGQNLHHAAVTVWERDREDSRTGVRTEVRARHVYRAINDLSGNPSNRRNGLTIEMSCEDCEGEAILEIVQHKGETQLSWRLV